ncbi:hypothetical protein VaNZ11_001506 [Volvox africanus]|uniref:Uncharacterized protein n=1 Tax=Volvox africanus TaxID=51714 RepID=A0ABQ5RPU4_9CHLO|nr:hypothetical protein VaNZ11_001506 [Volvox africanus]
MLGQQLRQRCIQAAFCPGTSHLGPSCLTSQASRLGLSTDIENQEREPPAPPSSSSSLTALASPSNNVAGGEIASGTGANSAAGAGQPKGAGQQKASSKPSPATAAAMADLRGRLAAAHVAPDKRPAPAAPPGNLAPPKPSTKPVLGPERRREVDDFQGLTLQLGEPGNPLQSMAVLTHADVRQLEDYAKDPLSSDRRFLTSLQKMAPAPQQRAAAIMQMATGTVPPPAVLIWAAQEVVTQMRQVLRERLAAAAQQQPQTQGQQQSQVPQQQQQQVAQGRGGAAALVSEPWYESAVQLARLEVGGTGGQLNAVRTELELLRAFAAGPQVLVTAAAASLPLSQQAASPAASYVPTWEALLALPQLQQLLDIAASRNPALATTLELAGLRPAADVPPTLPPAAAAALDQGSPSSGGGKEKQRQKAPVVTPSGSQDAWLLPTLRSAAAAARAKALEMSGLAGTGGDAPLDADAALTALALGTPRAEGAAVPPPSAEQRVAAADWLAATTLLRHAEELLGCAGGASGVRREAVAALHLLGLPLEPRELLSLNELKVSEQDLQTWLSQLSARLGGAGVGSDGTAALLVPPALESRLAAARQRLAAAGRALALVAPQPSSGELALAPEAAATQAWLRAVGAPLVSGLLSGGYGSLARLREMVPELREALVLRLLETGRMQGGTAALAAALYGDANEAWRAALADRAGATTAAALLQEEAVAAELDFVHDRYVATPPTPQVPRPLPSDAVLAAAVQALPPPSRLFYDSYFVLRAEGGDDAAVVQERRRVADALAAAGEGAVLQGVGDVQTWLAEARKGLLVLPAPLLGLLLRFLRLQVSVTPEEARSQRNKLTALAVLVAEQQRRAVAAAEGAGGGDGTAASAEIAARELAEWSLSGGGIGSEAAGHVPAALAALLGPTGAVDFASWLQALALSTSSPKLSSTHQMLALQHMEMDVERYLTMTHDPRLHLPVSGLAQSTATTASTPCRPTFANWTDPALRRSAGAFLEDMRPQLDAYLKALGQSPLGDTEWSVYRDAALQEWEAGRAEREERVASAGQSGFFNPRADEVYLQQMLEESIPIGDPLGPQSRRYLETLLRNPSWSFAQRRQAVQRLIQLNTHFASQVPAQEGGSPFAPLFAVGGGAVVPRLGPLREGEQKSAVVRPRGLGSRGRAAAKPLQLPKGF